MVSQRVQLRRHVEVGRGFRFEDGVLHYHHLRVSHVLVRGIPSRTLADLHLLSSWTPISVASSTHHEVSGTALRPPVLNYGEHSAWEKHTVYNLSTISHSATPRCTCWRGGSIRRLRDRDPTAESATSRAPSWTGMTGFLQKTNAPQVVAAAAQRATAANVPSHPFPTTSKYFGCSLIEAVRAV